MEQLGGSATRRRKSVAAEVRRRRARWALPATGLAGLAFLLTACTGSAQVQSSSSGAAAPAQADRAAGDSGGGAGAVPPGVSASPDGGSQPKAGTPSQPATQPQARIAPSRALIRKVELTVRVTDVAAKARDLDRIVQDTGGDIYTDDRNGAGPDASAQIVIKIDPDKLATALSRISALGDEVQRTSSTDDVTQEVADVESRVASMQASIARVRAILARASSIGDVVSVEGELSRREAELESLQARQRALAGQVALATVTVHLLAEQAPAPAAPVDTSEHGFGTGLKNGWNAFAGMVSWLLTVIGAILPFLLIVLPLLAAWWVVAQRRRSTAGTPAAPGLPAPPSPAV
jgi:hypothetical protein